MCALGVPAALFWIIYLSRAPPQDASEGYGKGQGGTTGEYASYRSWKNGTDGYVKIVIVGE